MTATILLIAKYNNKLTQYEHSLSINLILNRSRHIYLLEYTNPSNNHNQQQNLNSQFNSYQTTTSNENYNKNISALSIIDINSNNNYINQYHYLVNLKEYIRNQIELIKNKNRILTDSELESLKQEPEILLRLFINRLTTIDNEITLMKKFDYLGNIKMYLKNWYFSIFRDTEDFDLFKRNLNFNNMKLVLDIYPELIYLFFLVSKLFPDSELIMREKHKLLFDEYVSTANNSYYYINIVADIRLFLLIS